MTQRERTMELLTKLAMEREGEERVSIWYAINMLYNLGRGGRKRKISDVTRKQIARDKLDGYQNKEIAKRNNVSISTVCRIIREDGVQ